MSGSRPMSCTDTSAPRHFSRLAIRIAFLRSAAATNGTLLDSRSDQRLT